MAAPAFTCLRIPGHRAPGRPDPQAAALAGRVDHPPVAATGHRRHPADAGPASGRRPARPVYGPHPRPVAAALADLGRRRRGAARPGPPGAARPTTAVRATCCPAPPPARHEPADRRWVAGDPRRWVRHARRQPAARQHRHLARVQLRRAGVLYQRPPAGPGRTALPRPLPGPPARRRLCTGARTGRRTGLGRARSVRRGPPVDTAVQPGRHPVNLPGRAAAGR